MFDLNVKVDLNEVASLAAVLDTRAIAAELLRLKKRLELSEISSTPHLRAARAVASAAAFIDALFGPQDSTAITLAKVGAALKDLNGGSTASALFKLPQKRRGRPPDSIERRGVVKASSAAAMELLMQNGVKENIAARKVGQVLAQLKIPLGQINTTPGQTVKAWRKDIANGSVSDIGGQAYRAHIANRQPHALNEKQILDMLRGVLIEWNQ